MKKLLISILSVSAMALTVSAGDLRQTISVPPTTGTATNAVFLSMPIRSQPTAHVDNIMLGTSASATNLTLSLVIVGTTYTNTIVVYGPATVAANTIYQTTGKPVVGANDYFLVAFNGATNAVATQVYIGMQGY